MLNFIIYAVIAAVSLTGGLLYQNLGGEEENVGLATFKSVQLAGSPTANYILSTDGTDNSWIVNSGGGGGGGIFSTTSDNQLAYDDDFGSILIGGTATSSGWTDEEFNVQGNVLIEGTLNLATVNATTSIIFDSQTFTSFTNDGTLTNSSGDLRVVDVTCTDCLNATEIEDIYLLNGSSDVMTGTLTADGLTLGANENITLGAETLDHNGTDFIFSDQANMVGLISSASSTVNGALTVTGSVTLSTALTVANGGTGATSLTDGGILLGSGTGAITALGAAANGEIPIGDGTTDPVLATLTGGTNLTVVNGAGTITLNVDDAFLLNSGDTGTGAYDFGGATSIEIVNGTAPTIDAAGEIALDTTDGQLIIDDGSTDLVYPSHQKIIAFTLASTSVEFVSGGVLPFPPQRDGFSLTEFACYVQSGTSVVVNLSDGTNDTETITCATTLTTDTDVATNDTFTAGELGEVQIGTITGTPDYLTFTAYGYWTRE